MRIDATTRRQFNVVLHEVSDAIMACDGWVSNHQLFSNLMAMVAFEMPPSRVADFLAKLESCDIRISKAPDYDANSPHESSRGQINLSFNHSDPELRREVPAFG